MPCLHGSKQKSKGGRGRCPDQWAWDRVPHGLCFAQMRNLRRVLHLPQEEWRRPGSSWTRHGLGTGGGEDTTGTLQLRKRKHYIFPLAHKMARSTMKDCAPQSQPRGLETRCEGTYQQRTGKTQINEHDQTPFPSPLPLGSKHCL